MNRSLPLALAALIALSCGAPRSVSVAPRGSGLPPGAERAYRALEPRFDRAAAMEIISFMDQYWRLAANPGFNASIEHIRTRLAAAGFGTAPDALMRVDEFAGGARGWDHQVGTLAFVDGLDPVLLSRDRDRVSLAINSFSTPKEGVRAPLIDVGAGTPTDYARQDVRGAVVLGDAPLGALWQEAVKKRGAIGVVSSEIAPYIRPSDPASMSDPQKDVLQWGSIPYDEAVKGFGFKASWRAADRMRQRLRSGPADVRVEIDATFAPGPTRTLVAEIAGRSRPDERIVMVAHVQEPGANDDASGCATLYGLARALKEAIAAGVLPRPDRTLTFMWVDEIGGTQQWIRTRSEEARGVRYMFSLDMTGEDTSKTGGTFLIEKQADPSAVWPRPSDPHSEWGGGGVREASLKGSLLNDLHLAVCLRRSEATGWVVRTNPYEGGSDHTVFASAGVPSLLNWHFTDRYYHTNQDRPDKTSADEMANVGIAVGTSAWFLASADVADAARTVDLVESAGVRRLALERQQGSAIVARAADRSEAEAIEGKVIAAWIKWYGEALDSVLELPAGGANAALRARVADARRRLQ